MCSSSDSSSQEAAEWINGWKWLVRKLALGVCRRRSSNGFSFEKVLGNDLKDQLKLKQNCLKFSKLSVYIETCTYREWRKGREDSDLSSSFFGINFQLLLQ